MSKYSKLTDCSDKGLMATQADLDNADDFINSYIAKLGIDPGEVKPNGLLKSIAVHYSYYCIAIRSAGGQDTALIDKADRYRRLYQDELETISRSSLGLDQAQLPKSGLGTIPMLRG
mgnify:CR=1 FL=1